MKKTILAVFLIFCAFFCIYGQNTSPIDLILLLDSSTGMSSSYETVNDYLTGPFLSEFLRLGDTFHLITFFERQRLDVARRVAGIGDIETIIARMLLQYPVERGSSVGAAISYAENYISSLPARPKKIVLITTGGSDTGALVSSARQRLNSANTTIDYIQVVSGQPLSNLPASGRTPAARTPAASPAQTQTTAAPAAAAQTTAPAASATPAAAQTQAASPAQTAAASTAPVQTPARSAAAAPAAQTQTAQTTVPAAAASITPAQTTAPAAASITPSQTTTQAAASITPAQTTAQTQTAQTTAPVAASSIAPIQTAAPAAQTQPVQTTIPDAALITPAQTASAAAALAATAASSQIETAADGAAAAVSAISQAASENAAQQTGGISTGITSAQNRTSSAQGESIFSSMPFLIGLIILILLILGLLIFFASRKLKSSPNRVMAEAATEKAAAEKTASEKAAIEKAAAEKPAALKLAAAKLAALKPAPAPKENAAENSSRELANFASVQNRRTTPYDDQAIEKVKPVEINPKGPLLLNLFVEDQNTSIGKRNIHSMKSGYSLSLGGAKGDDFYIFLVPMPAHIGDIRRDEGKLTFIPRKAKYFPDIGSNEVSDCINKTIKIVSDKNYEIRFRFEMYEDPLVSLNRMLTSVKVPG